MEDDDDEEPQTVPELEAEVSAQLVSLPISPSSVSFCFCFSLCLSLCLFYFYSLYLFSHPSFSFTHPFHRLPFIIFSPQAKPLVTEEAEMAGPQQAEETGSRGPFLQAVHRESVIMLCSGQNLFRQTPARGTTPATDTQAPSSPTKPHCPSTRPVGTLPGPLQQPSGSKVTANLESTVPTKVTSLCRKRGRVTHSCYCLTCFLQKGLKSSPDSHLNVLITHHIRLC